MSDTAKTTENVVNRRRASDWKKPATVLKHDVFGWHEDGGVAFLDDKAVARVGAALSGARTIAAILMQREMDRNNDDDQEAGLQLDEVTACGLLNALAACIEVAEHHATEDATWTTRLNDHDAKDAEQLRNAAFSVYLQRRDRHAVERVEQINRAKAFKSAKKAGGAA